MKKGNKEEIKEESPKGTLSEMEEKMSDNEGKVGGMLHDARVKKGYKLDDVSKELYIRTSFLEAIESSNYEEIPEAPYGIGFIRSYAEFLGLNSARIVQLFKEETDAKNQKDDVYVLEPQAEATMPNKKYLGISVIAVALLYAAWLGYNKAQFEEGKATVGEDIVAEVTIPQTSENFPLQVEDFATVEGETLSETSGIPVIDTTAAPVEETPQVTVSEENFVEEPQTVETKETPTEEEKVVTKEEKLETKEAKSEDKVSEEQNKQEEVKEEKKENTKAGSRVTIKVNKETWVEVKDNKKLWLSKVLKAGDSYKVPAGEGTILSVGRFDAVDVEIDGKIVPGIFTSNKKTGIALDKYLSATH